MEEREQSTALVLRDDVGKYEQEFSKLLPAHIRSERFVRTAQSAVIHTRGIEKVTDRASLLAACSKAAQDGLILDGREAALVVNARGGVDYRPMMRGLLKLAHQSGAIRSIVVEPVHTNDFFDHEPTNTAHPITHRIDHRQPRGEIFAVYALAELVNGGIAHEVMSVDAINLIRNRSDAYKAFKAQKIKSTPWHTDWSEMARKTVFRRISKYLPSSTDREEGDRFRSAVERLDEDFTFDETDAANTSEKPATRRRGAAAAAINRAAEAEKAAEPPVNDDVIDGEFSEVGGEEEQSTGHDDETGELIDDEQPKTSPRKQKDPF